MVIIMIMMMMMMSMIMTLMIMMRRSIRRRKMVVMILMMITKTLMNSKMQTLHESLRPKYERHQSKEINKTISLVHIPLAVVSWPANMNVITSPTISSSLSPFPLSS